MNRPSITGLWSPNLADQFHLLLIGIQARLFLLTTLTFTFYHITSINSYKPKLFSSYKHNSRDSNRQYIITSIFINDACLSVSNSVLEVYMIFIQKWNRFKNTNFVLVLDDVDKELNLLVMERSSPKCCSFMVCLTVVLREIVTIVVITCTSRLSHPTSSYDNKRVGYNISAESVGC